MKKRITAAISVMTVITALVFSGCAEEEENSYTRELFAMDTVMYVTAYGKGCEKATQAAVDEIQRLDSLLSVGDPESEISRINSGETVRLSGDTKTLAERSLDLYEQTEGAYDMSLFPLMELWGFTGDNPAVPSDSEIEKTLRLCGSDKVNIENGTITLAEGRGIDLGGIAKGYTGSRIMEIFKENGITSGIISLGGNVQCSGIKPDGSPWRCGITDPESPDDGSLLGVLTLTDRAVVTSGGYQRYFDEGGTRYHHIMDPSTGRPADSGLTSVTVISPDGTLADGLSTACFVMGKERSLALWRTSDEEFELVLVSSDGSMTITSGIADCFSSNREYSVAE